jgi:hypothetical protein
MNLGQIRERVKYRVRDIGNVLTSDTIWNGHINAAYHKFLMRTGYNLEVSTTDISFSSGDDAQPLPEGVFSVLKVHDIANDETLEPLLTWRALTDIFPDFDESGSSTHFRITGNTVRLYPVTDRAVTLRVWYYEPADELEDDGDIPIIPNRYHEALVFGAAAEAHRDDQNLQVAASYDKQFEELVAEAVSELTEPVHGEFVPLPRARRGMI